MRKYLQMLWLQFRTLKKLTPFLALALLGTGAIAKAAEDVPLGGRMALLVGNSDYPDFQLPGVGKSLDEVERGLKPVGFRIVRKENLGEKELKAAAEEFARSVPTNGVAVVYFAGLGAHIERLGKQYNLLRPVGEKIESDNDYRSRGLDVADLIEQLKEQSGSRVNLIFLDACWDSPIRPEKGNVKSGFVEFDVPPETMVLFAADSGKSLPPPEHDEPSALANALAQNAGQIEKSLKQSGEALAANLGGAWFGGATDAGIGPPSPFPMTEELREGKTSGEGFTNSVGMTFRWCPPGQFTMGSQRSQQPRHPRPQTGRGHPDPGLLDGRARSHAAGIHRSHAEERQRGVHHAQERPLLGRERSQAHHGFLQEAP